MAHFSVIFLITVPIIVTISMTKAYKGPNKLQRELPDVLQIFENFPLAVAIVDTDGDKEFECLTARRKDFDPEVKKATYVWSLSNGEGNKRKHAAFYHTIGATPDATNFTVGKNSKEVEVAYFRYTDYKTCSVMEVGHYGEQCILWVAKEVENSVPAHCLQQFDDICGVGVSVHDSDICVDSDDDAEDDD